MTNLKVVNVDDFLTALDRLPLSVAVFGGGADTYQIREPTWVYGNDFVLEWGIVAVCFIG